ncbi:helix-turn-helix domain-containing protein [Phaeovulum sp. W22_SRMD_FR3]|uniref:helix-turn-helix domain-containing protein n=1 Tax=Phaeovulum sp. W22_SRMD_FR3 TaxID=3240274 RepID=UPI003F95024E
MLSIPLPFVVAILLIFLLAEVVRRDDGLCAGGAPGNTPFLVLILVSILQSVLSGLRWGYGVQEVAYLMPVIAATVPPLAYAGVSQLVRASPLSGRARLILHMLPVALIVLLLLVWRDALDIVLALIFMVYAGAILALMRTGTDALQRLPFENATPAFRSILFAACALLFSAALDIYVFLDFSEGRSRHALTIITLGNLAALIILSLAAAIAGRNPSADAEPEAAPGPEGDGDRDTMDRVTLHLRGRQVYRDPELTLDRLARKVLIPARQISGAINRTTGKNVSQYVNEYRIAEACQHLSETDKPVTEIMFDVGFQTKSNFNREFRRVTDMTPIQWREKHRAAAPQP